jgi:hypothetical protein
MARLLPPFLALVIVRLGTFISTPLEKTTESLYTHYDARVICYGY